MFFIKEIWMNIKEYLFHNIKKQGKHLKEDTEIIKYNNVMKTIPNPIISRTGPRIIYTDSRKKTRFLKFIYHIKYKNINKTLIEYMVLPNNYINYNKMYDVVFRNYYHYQYLYN